MTAKKKARIARKTAKKMRKALGIPKTRKGALK